MRMERIVKTTPEEQERETREYCMSGVTFDEAWNTRGMANASHNVKVPILSSHELLKDKRAAARLQELADVEKLTKWHDLSHG